MRKEEVAIEQARRTLQQRLQRSSKEAKGYRQSFDDQQDVRLSELALFCEGRAMLWATKPSWELVTTAQEVLVDLPDPRRLTVKATIARELAKYQEQKGSWTRQTDCLTIRRACMQFACAVLEAVCSAGAASA